HAVRNTAILMMTFGLGLRIGEVASLRVGDVLGNDGELREVFNITKARSKTNQNREVYLTNPKVRRAVMAYLDERRRQGDTLSPGSHLFQSQKGGGFTANSLQQTVKRLFRKAGLPDSVKSHSGRRGFATKLIASGVDIKSVSVLMGHANISQTAQYAEANPHTLRQVAAGAI
ncbi:MAG: site-specific integrase, partial [Alphaproteobacteria bacterium]|nr:site-specific integrase [Alphaproteobacteria bacterium]